MSSQIKVSPRMLSLSLLLSYACATIPCFATGKITEYVTPTTPYAPPASSTTVQPLQGGIQDQSYLNPSLRLTPTYYGRVPAYGGTVRPLTPKPDYWMPEQFKGNVRVSAPNQPTAAVVQSPLTGGMPTDAYGRISGVIPPISSYRHTPGSTVVNYTPGSDFVSSTTGGTSSVSSAPTHYKTVGRGLTVLDPQFAVTSFAPALPAVAYMGTPVQMIVPGYNNLSITRTAGAEAIDSHYVTKHGITTAPGFEVTIKPPGLEKETLGGVWSADNTHPVSLAAVPGRLSPQGIFTNIEPIRTEPQRIFTAVGPVSEMARPGLLTQLQASRTSTSWGQWYRSVANSIYRHWQEVDVCPGTTKLEVTVQANHDISGKVIEFIPAVDIERNVPNETAFRETSVKIVNQLGFFEIPDFPDQKSSQVSFEIELKRTVNGPTGVTLVNVPSK